MVPWRVLRNKAMASAGLKLNSTGSPAGGDDIQAGVQVPVPDCPRNPVVFFAGADSYSGSQL